MTMLNTNTTYPIKAKSKNVIRIFFGVAITKRCSDLGGVLYRCTAMILRRGHLLTLPKSEQRLVMNTRTVLNICTVPKHCSPQRMIPLLNTCTVTTPTLRWPNTVHPPIDAHRTLFTVARH